MFHIDFLSGGVGPFYHSLPICANCLWKASHGRWGSEMKNDCEAVRWILHSFDLRSQRLELGLDPLIAPVDLVDVVDDALTFGAE